MSETGPSLIPVPERGPDRKRALNVLAQRRYPAIYIDMFGTSCLSPHTLRESEDADPAQSDSPSNSEAFSSHINLIGDETDIYSESNVIYDTGAMNDLANFDMASFSHTDFVPELQSLETSQYTFPDDENLDVPELQVMKAGLNIAEMVGCVETIWDMSTLRVFDKSSIATPFLPPNLEPTEVQRRIPHHPLFDILPWPSVRTKLVIIFSQPVHTRPPAAQDPMALMQLVYDMDDSAEGLRVTGSDWHSTDNWEVGQVFFKNWWWALDRSIVDTSNKLRAKRGAQKLVLGAP